MTDPKNPEDAEPGEWETSAHRVARYTFNPACVCDWCRNAGKPPEGYWINGMYGRVYEVTDSYGNEHMPPSSQTRPRSNAMTLTTNTYGGKVDHRAVIGHAPESRDWKPGDPAYEPVISSDARIEAFVTVDSGVVQPTIIGARTWLMKKTHVGHDAQIGADCELAPGAVICGHAEIGDGVKIGVNACVLPYRKVGAGARIGAGAVVTKDVPAREVWAGNPASPIYPTHCATGHKIHGDEWARRKGLFSCGCPDSSPVAAQIHGLAA